MTSRNGTRLLLNSVNRLILKGEQVIKPIEMFFIDELGCLEKICEKIGHVSHSGGGSLPEQLNTFCPIAINANRGS